MSEPTTPFLVGIDLGTTHTALTYVRAPEADSIPAPLDWAIPQLSGPGQLESWPLLPSAIYIPSEQERGRGIHGPDWMPREAPIVGRFALEYGRANPSRLISSAKSWLCHPGIDRTSPALPWGAPEGIERISPVEAVHWILRHLRHAWDHTMAAEDSAWELARQEVLITVPASFDAVARQLTVEAARAAGLPDIKLLEEPQAAFYAWLAQEGDRWREQVAVGERILICDIGGGTTDLTLVEARDIDGQLELERIAVGDHLLLGGDNMDLALAYAVQADLEQQQNIRLNQLQRTALQHACRQAKEQFFADPSMERATLTLLGSGSGVIGGTRTYELARTTVEAIILEGFFPLTAPEELPVPGLGLGLQELGLPFASDPAISRHLAQFLASVEDPAGRVAQTGALSAVLFNGGVFNAVALRRRILDLLAHWRASQSVAPDRPPVRSLDEARTDLAVARGATYFGLVRHGSGIRIRAGVGRTYYLGVQAAAPAVPGLPPRRKAVSIIPFGTEEETCVRVREPEFGLLVGRPASFELYSSTIRRSDPPGTILEAGDEWDALELTAPIQAVLAPSALHPAGMVVPVHLECTPTAVGTLDLQCVDREGSGRWTLEFDLRARKES